MIKQDFPCELPFQINPDWEQKFYLPKAILDWINYFEDWWKAPFDRCKGLWITGATRTGKTSLISTLGPFNYFPNVWNMENFGPGKKFNFLMIKILFLNLWKILGISKVLLVLKRF